MVHMCCTPMLTHTWFAIYKVRSDVEFKQLASNLHNNVCVQQRNSATTHAWTSTPMMMWGSLRRSRHWDRALIDPSTHNQLKRLCIRGAYQCTLDEVWIRLDIVAQLTQAVKVWEHAALDVIAGILSESWVRRSYLATSASCPWMELVMWYHFGMWLDSKLCIDEWLLQYSATNYDPIRSQSRYSAIFNSHCSDELVIHWVIHLAANTSWQITDNRLTLLDPTTSNVDMPNHCPKILADIVAVLKDAMHMEWMVLVHAQRQHPTKQPQ